MSSRLKQERLEKRVAELRRRPENKLCCDCRDKNPTSVVLDLATFICTNCTAFHRAQNRKCVTMTMYTFTEKDVTRLEEGGNAVANAYWLAEHTASDMQPPPLDAEKSTRDACMSELIRLKYVAKKWVHFDRSAASAAQLAE